jgi:hypothetical protein
MGDAPWPLIADATIKVEKLITPVRVKIGNRREVNRLRAFMIRASSFKKCLRAPAALASSAVGIEKMVLMATQTLLVPP